MMAELEKQFLTEPDETFGDHVVASLLQARQVELSNGIKRIQQDAQGIEKRWIPLVDSMRILLEEELMLL